MDINIKVMLGRAGHGSLSGTNSAIIPPTISPADLNGCVSFALAFVRNRCDNGSTEVGGCVPWDQAEHTLFLANSGWSVHSFGPQGTPPGGAVSVVPFYGVRVANGVE